MLSLDHKRHLVEKPQSAEAGTAGTFCAFCASDIGKRGGSPCTLWACLGAGQLDNIFRFAWPEYARNFRPAALHSFNLLTWHPYPPGKASVAFNKIRRYPRRA